MRLDSFRTGLDIALDFIPFVSTVNSGIDLFQKNIYYKNEIDKDKLTKAKIWIAFSQIEQKGKIKKIASKCGNNYYEHLAKKSNFRCLATLVPIAGNIGLAIYVVGKKSIKVISCAGIKVFKAIDGFIKK